MATERIFISISTAPAWHKWALLFGHWGGAIAVLWFNYSYLGNGWALQSVIAIYILSMAFGLTLWARGNRGSFSRIEDALVWLQKQASDEGSVT